MLRLGSVEWTPRTGRALRARATRSPARRTSVAGTHRGDRARSRARPRPARFPASCSRSQQCRPVRRSPHSPGLLKRARHWRHLLESPANAANLGYRSRQIGWRLARSQGTRARASPTQPNLASEVYRHRISRRGRSTSERARRRMAKREPLHLATGPLPVPPAPRDAGPGACSHARRGAMFASHSRSKSDAVKKGVSAPPARSAEPAPAFEDPRTAGQSGAGPTAEAVALIHLSRGVGACHAGRFKTRCGTSRGAPRPSRPSPAGAPRPARLPGARA